jgi:hypothetical protein
MELWLCPRNKYALLRTKEETTIFEIAEPFNPIAKLVSDEKFTLQERIDAFVKKHGAVKALISGHEIPDDKKKILNVIDFGAIHQVRVLTPVSGHKKYLTFLAFVGQECAYLQFYVDRKRNARCMARNSIQAQDKWGVRVGSSLPAFLIFDH